jgi:hypothetical protein
MHIEFARSGGFAGIEFMAKIDTAELAPDEARKVKEMVEAAGFFNLLAVTPRPARGADQFQYSVTIEEEGRKRTVQLSEEEVTESL